MQRPTWSGRVGPVLLPAGGLLVVAAAFLPWVDRGAGSSLALHDLGDLLLGGSVSSVVPRWAGLVAYVIPAGAAAMIVAAGVEGRRGRRATIGLVVALAALVATATVVPFVRDVRPGPGQVVAWAGVLIAALGGLLTTGSENRSVPSNG